MEWNDLRVFLEVARTGTLAAAAKRLDQTQPTMGRRLSALERSVGHALFQRTSKGFFLTEEGKSVLVRAERIEEEAFAFERELAGKNQELRGLIRVTSSDWFGDNVLTPVFAEYLKLHSKVVIELLSESRSISLSRQEADLAFRIQPFDEQDVIQKKVMHVPYGLYCGKKIADPQKNGKGSRLITLNTAYDDFPDVEWAKYHLSGAEVIFRSNSREAQARMCAMGLGLAVLPVPLAEKMSSIRRLPVKEQPPGRDVWMGHHRDLSQLSRLRALLDLVSKRFT